MGLVVVRSPSSKLGEPLMKPEGLNRGFAPIDYAWGLRVVALSFAARFLV